MSALAVSFRSRHLPWSPSPDDERRFHRILRDVLGVATILCLLMLFMPTPKVDRTQPQELPPRLAKLLLEREPAPAPKPIVKEAPKAADKAVPAPNPREVAKPTPPKPLVKGAEVPEARNPQPNKPPGEIGEARRKAAGVGLLALKDQLAEMHGAPVAVQLKQDIKPGPGVGTGVGVGVGAGTEAGLPVRAMVTSNATGGSGGINTAGYSRNTGGGGLAGRSTTLVAGVAGGGGGGGYGGGGSKGVPGGTGTGAGGTLHKGGSGKASRSIEEIKLVFERNKGAIYAIYNRALREDPTLQGKVVVELKIAPSGAVLDCRVVSSELKASELEGKLLARIRQFDFGAKDVDQMNVTWPVDFLPS
jgi:TonB family protein